ncbi:auxilin-like clathrin-binding protein required for normal clathrin function [Dispira parvispora]|uniref:Auxilin-like clathrin-binding protein required for normal clathrin function n=1 Tax=Dispira parvispora TaxID=1520584 RepID=A0A9W8ASW4_9FUNG|nr:auxilin-like clathrin-binding protein required for normal clathrin function [Dispira parvispora]
MDDLSDLIWKGQPTRPTDSPKTGGESLSSLAAQQAAVNIGAAPTRTTLTTTKRYITTTTKTTTTLLRTTTRQATGTTTSTSAINVSTNTNVHNAAATSVSSTTGGTFWQMQQAQQNPTVSSPLALPTMAPTRSQPSPFTSPKPLLGTSPAISASRSPQTQAKPTPSTPSADPFDQLLNFSTTQSGGSAKHGKEPKLSLVEIERRKIEQKLQDKKNQEHQWDLNFLESATSSQPSGVTSAATSTVTSPPSLPDPLRANVNLSSAAKGTPVVMHPTSVHSPLPHSAQDSPAASTTDPLDFLTISTAITTNPPLQVSSGAAHGSPSMIPESVLNRTGSPIPMFSPDDEPTTGGGNLSPAVDTSLDSLIAELAALGFTTEQAQTALTMTETGRDVEQAKRFLHQNQQALHSILNQRDSRPRNARRGGTGRYRDMDSEEEDELHLSRVSANRHRRPGTAPQRSNSDHPSLGSASGREGASDELGDQIRVHKERIFATANELGTNVMSKATSFFQMGKSRIQRTIEELQADGMGAHPADNTSEDSQTPRWMRESRMHARRPETFKPLDGTDQDQPSGWKAATNRPGRRSPVSSGNTLSGGSQINWQTAASSDESEDDLELSRAQEAAIEERKRAYYQSRANKPQPASPSTSTPERRTPPTRSKPEAQAPKVKPKPEFLRGQPLPNLPSASTSSAAISPYHKVPQGKPVIATIDKVLTSHRYKVEGNRQFKLGQFAEAHTWYKRALEVLPSHHVLSVPLYNNQATAAMKMGEHRQVIESCDHILQGSDLTWTSSKGGGSPSPAQRTSLQYGWYWWCQHIADTMSGVSPASLTNPNAWQNMVRDVLAKASMTSPYPELTSVDDDAIPSALVELQFSLLDQRLKAYQKKATAWEQLEKYQDAIQVNQQILTEIGSPMYSTHTASNSVKPSVGGPVHAGLVNKTRATAQDSLRRCQKALRMASNPHPAKPNGGQVPSKSSPTTRVTTPAVDLNPFRASATPVEGSRVQELRRQEAKKLEEDNQRHQLKDSVDFRLAQWQQGKEGNLRALLASVDTLLWPELAWKKVGLHELVSSAQVKRAYLRAISKVHPDKLKPQETVERCMLANGIFSSLNDAWFTFKSQNGL